SREITRVLGGELKVESQPDKGSTFTLYLPLTYSPAAQPLRPAAQPGMPALALPVPAQADAEPAQTVLDDRDNIEEDDCVTLIVEDDPRFAAILLAAAFSSRSTDAGATEPNALISLAYIGPPLLAAALLTLGIGLVRAGAQ
ncbi:MAG: hypothetical protein KY450_12375, partial [Actinobacteria bacterium]|nr:hypothetical protein [Actinomycetota bacterium]